MDEDIADYSQKISFKNSEKPSIEQDNLTQSAIPMSSGTNNSHVGEFEDILGQMKEKPKDKSKSDNSFKKKRQIPKNKTSEEINEEKEEDENEEEESEENEIENDNEEEEEEEEQDQEDESNSRINIDKEKEKNEKERQKQINKTTKSKKEVSLSNFELINQDEKLKPFELNIKQRILHYKKTLNEIIKLDKSLENFSKSYENMGITILPNGDIKYREYAPGAKGISLFGEFNN